MTAVDRELLREALHELVQLRTGTLDHTRVESQLYGAALEEWAKRLGVETRNLHKLVLVKEVVPIRRVR